MAKVKHFESILEIGPDQWLGLEDPHFPFSDYDFLRALEDSDSVGERTGWFPHYVGLYRDQSLVAVLLVYIKTNSYGEYIFDWDWARGFQQCGLPYYPKLVTAIPFTPATGPKILARPEEELESLVPIFQVELKTLADKLGASSIHHYFVEEKLCNLWQNQGYLKRLSQQYHWYNSSYSSFDDFLNHLKSKRAKEIRRERKKVRDQNIKIEILTGDQIQNRDSDIFYQFYKSTIAKKLAFEYLTQEFFSDVFLSMKDRIVLCLATEGSTPIAASLSFKKGKKLYGRYWGCSENYKNLHFELCYYQLIEYAIANKLEIFEAGAQGRHKRSRGFETSWTYSCHLIQNPALSKAIERYIDEESQILQQVMQEDRIQSPFKF